jgi:tRNA A-37 threonylcarbamoyl transferase component Bud32
VIGKTVSHYNIISKLGEGGMGVVYKAEDTKLKRTVALKFFSSQSLGTQDEKTRFVHEAQAAAALDHPNICTVHEIDEADGHTFIAMAYVEGESLKDRIDRGPLEVTETLDIISQVAMGLSKAHEKNIVHRDVKPANILMTPDGVARIVDFGLAKLEGRTKVTRAGTTVGTVAYMSPEQTRGDDVDHRADIWSLGVMLYEMITGAHPFPGDHEAAVMYGIINEDPAPLDDHHAGISSELQAIVDRALTKDASGRYGSAIEMLEDLQRVAGETTTGAPAMNAVIGRLLDRERISRSGSEGRVPSAAKTLDTSGHRGSTDGQATFRTLGKTRSPFAAWVSIAGAVFLGLGISFALVTGQIQDGIVFMGFGVVLLAITPLLFWITGLRLRANTDSTGRLRVTRLKEERTSKTTFFRVWYIFMMVLAVAFTVFAAIDARSLWSSDPGRTAGRGLIINCFSALFWWYWVFRARRWYVRPPTRREQEVEVEGGYAQILSRVSDVIVALEARVTGLDLEKGEVHATTSVSMKSHGERITFAIGEVRPGRYLVHMQSECASPLAVHDMGKNSANLRRALDILLQ